MKEGGIGDHTAQRSQGIPAVSIENGLYEVFLAGCYFDALGRWYRGTPEDRISSYFVLVAGRVKPVA